MKSFSNSMDTSQLTIDWNWDYKNRCFQMKKNFILHNNPFLNKETQFQRLISFRLKRSSSSSIEYFVWNLHGNRFFFITIHYNGHFGFCLIYEKKRLAAQMNDASRQYFWLLSNYTMRDRGHIKKIFIVRINNVVS